MPSKPDEAREIGTMFADTVEEIAEKLEGYANERIRNKELLGPVPRHLVLTVRPLGTHMIMQREIPIDVSRKHHQLPTLWLRDELRKIFQGAERMSARKRTLSVEVVSEFGEKIVDIRVATAAKATETIAETVSAPAGPAAKVLPAPDAQDPAPSPLTAPEASALQPAPEPPEPSEHTEHPVEPAAEENKSPPPPESKGKKNPELIDFSTMKYFPTDMTHIVVRKTLMAGGITTKQQLLDLLGTTTPNRTDWEVFIKKLSKIAKDAGFKFFSSSDGTLYWWLTKRMKWILPFPPGQG